MGNKLKKQLTIFQIIAMSAGAMIAAWMVEIKYWFELTGPSCFLALALCAVLVLPLCLVYSEMSSMLPYAGGENVWISNAFNWNVGWFMGWALLLIYILAMPTVSYGIASMIGYIYPLTFLQTKLIAGVIIVIWFFITFKEVKVLARIQNILFWSTLVVSIGASLIFITSGQWSIDTMKPFFSKGISGFGVATGVLVMKFIGFEVITQLSEESDFPKSKIWVAFIGALGLTLLIYGLAIFGVAGIVSTEWIINTDIVDPRVADMIGYHWLALVIVIMGTLTCITTLSGFWLSGARLLYGSAKQKQFSSFLDKLNDNGQPVRANVIIGILALYFVVFAPESWINYLYNIYGITAGIVYIMVALSFIILRKKKPSWDRPYKVKYTKIISVLSVIFPLWVIISSIIEMSRDSWIVLGVYIAMGLPFFLYAKYMQKKKPQDWKPMVISPDNQEVNNLEK